MWGISQLGLFFFLSSFFKIGFNSVALTDLKLTMYSWLDRHSWRSGCLGSLSAGIKCVLPCLSCIVHLSETLGIPPVLYWACFGGQGVPAVLFWIVKISTGDKQELSLKMCYDSWISDVAENFPTYGNFKPQFIELPNSSCVLLHAYFLEVITYLVILLNKTFESDIKVET